MYLILQMDVLWGGFFLFIDSFKFNKIPQPQSRDLSACP
ncbi:hypothetical protein CLV31_10794 [Algoriphagus aquaeductus]|uniref:Uncharacterized protein n=1 Tax=Algoriphagus aquaeductus TaxID=475299 RepID=A0A326RXT7_9BACT|nr:hypothetical protein CLV31_10794 [Algoriphagus aquaeductus]